MKVDDNMDEKIKANIKTLTLDMLYSSKGGNIGLNLSALPIIYTLFSKHLNISLNDPVWVNRDRLVVSSNISALMYATLHMAGYNITINDLKNYQKVGSKTPGYLDLKTSGVEMSTGSFGQGFASAVGMALGQKILSSKYVIPTKNKIMTDNRLIDYKVYVYVSSSDMMEGIANEAASFAGHLKLNNLIVLYDANGFTLDGSISKTFSENVLKKFSSFGFKTIKVDDGKNINKISRAIEKAKCSSKPTIIEFKTLIGEGLEDEGKSSTQNRIVARRDVESTKMKLGVTNEEFFVYEDVKEKFKEMIASHSSSKYSKWASNYEAYVNTYLEGDFSKLNYLFDRIDKYDLLNKFHFEKDLKEPLTLTNQKVMMDLAKLCPNFIGGSAGNLISSYMHLDNYTDISSKDYNGRNIYFGNREMAMGCILNGLVLSKFKVFGSTYLSLADNVKSSIRLSAFSNLPVIYIFSHDSINSMPEEPIYQPMEQLIMLRSIPNLNVYRPADANELVGCWNEIINSKTSPSALVLSSADTSILLTTRSDLVSRGGYIVYQVKDVFNAVIVATGSDVHTAYHIADNLWKEKKISIRVVSIPSMELYLNQPIEYRNRLIPFNIKTFVIESGSSYNWGKIIHDEGSIITIDRFGISGSPNDILKYCYFNYESIKDRIVSNL